MHLEDAWQAVRDFHLTFGHPIAELPQLLSPERSASRITWMREEVREFEEALALAEQADAMIDLIYFALGTLVEMGVRPDRLFDVVHAANMTKLWSDGIARKRSDGKTVKPPGWVDPAEKITDELARQAREKDREIRTPHRYKAIKAAPYMCLAAVLAMIIEAVSGDCLRPEELAEELGICIPEAADAPVHNTVVTADGMRWGMVVDDGILGKLFQRIGVGLREEYVPISRLQDWEFEQLIEDRLRQGAHVACGYSYHVLAGRGQPDVGHASIVVALLPEHHVTLIDPGPDGFGMREVDSGLLYAAVRARGAGLWVFHPALTAGQSDAALPYEGAR